MDYISFIRSKYLPHRLKLLDPDFLEFEEEMSSEEDLEKISRLLYPPCSTLGKFPNPYNSCLLYAVGLTDVFDSDKERADTTGGSPPDIDVDFEKLRRDEVMQWAVEHWGRERVANISTFQTFGPRSLLDKYYKIMEGNPAHKARLKRNIPGDKHGKAATLTDMLESHPELEDEFPEFFKVAHRLEGMISYPAFHPAGLVLSDANITDHLPVWKNKESDAITQWDMHEVEELGAIKFDFLVLVNLDILNETVRLVKKHQGEEIDLYALEDGDERTYKLMQAGFLEGIFQFETSSIVKSYFQHIAPRSLEELSDISALNRPGPMQAGLDKQYIENKREGVIPADLPPVVAETLEKTHYTLVYQEQVMQLMSTLAGFSEAEADDIRRAMGKKKPAVLAKWRGEFISGCERLGIVDKSYAKQLWIVLAGRPEDPNDNGFADYCFSGDTLVQTTEGPVSIEELATTTRAPQIFVYENGEPIASPILQGHKVSGQQAYTYTLSDGTEVTCSPEHKFLSTSGSMISIQEALEQQQQLAKIHPLTGSNNRS